MGVNAGRVDSPVGLVGSDYVVVVIKTSIEDVDTIETSPLPACFAVYASERAKIDIVALLKEIICCDKITTDLDCLALVVVHG